LNFFSKNNHKNASMRTNGRCWSESHKNIWIKTFIIESEENNFKLEMWYCFLCTIALLSCIFITIVKKNVQKSLKSFGKSDLIFKNAGQGPRISRPSRVSFKVLDRVERQDQLLVSLAGTFRQRSWTVGSLFSFIFFLAVNVVQSFVIKVFVFNLIGNNIAL